MHYSSTLKWEWRYPLSFRFNTSSSSFEAVNDLIRFWVSAGVPQLLPNRKPKWLCFKRWADDFLLTQYFIENFSVFLHSDILQRVLMWSSGPLTAAAIIYTHATLTKHTTCNVTKQHLSILFSGNRPIAPNQWNNYRPLNTVSYSRHGSCCGCPLMCATTTPTPGEKFVFLLLVISLHRLHSLQSNFSADSQPASLYYSCSLLSFRTPFCLSAEWHATVRHGAELLLCAIDVFWILAPVKEMAIWTP